jgi:hypothetical protein
MGTRAAGTMIGEWSGLATGLDALGNVKATCYFRGLYCALLEQWLGYDAGSVIPAAAVGEPRDAGGERAGVWGWDEGVPVGGPGFMRGLVGLGGSLSLSPRIRRA